MALTTDTHQYVYIPNVEWVSASKALKKEEGVMCSAALPSKVTASSRTLRLKGQEGEKEWHAGREEERWRQDDKQTRWKGTKVRCKTQRKLEAYRMVIESTDDRNVKRWRDNRRKDDTETSHLHRWCACVWNGICQVSFCNLKSETVHQKTWTERKICEITRKHILASLKTCLKQSTTLVRWSLTFACCTFFLFFAKGC